MKAIVIRTAATGALLLGFLLWMYGGARAGFYQTFYRVRHFDEILEIEHFEEVEALLPGIETLGAGVAAFFFLSLWGNLLERRSAA
ncbi:hypothetical protein [Pelagicoccus mobilis]|uniref:Uncharacterized protein n=1 Tax=Pelagicoccus mobilis TaxID=415221 RepID=A0A934RW69_9BACT|nr:hypothetical protein [Pelagicoccus mobilis]MBK1875532.1 hypothetical protein [Pelagicoccus mobilis]